MRTLFALAAACLLAACDGSSSDDNLVMTPDSGDTEPPPAVTPAGFEITATNLTVGQPLSPLAIAIHDSSLSVLVVGERASPGLELLAEGGDNSEWLAELESRAAASGDNPLVPGASETLSLSLDNDETAGLALSVVSMLVNTNDALTGVVIDLSALAVGDSLTRFGNAYDAGTEANSEAPGTIPGPADGGEGFNADRDDVGDFITMHPGVVTADDGLAGSVLNQDHRFDNPVVRFTVTRTQ